MKNLFKVQYIVILICIVVGIWLTLISLNSSRYTQNLNKSSEAEGEHSAEDGAIAKMIDMRDTAGLLSLVQHVEQSGDFASHDVIAVTSAYQFLLNANLLSSDQKVRYAQLKMDNATGDNDVMIGVTTLLDVIKTDSNNIAALEVLGERSIQSGQLEKARKRYEKLLSLQPQNREYQERLKFIDGSLNK